MNMLKLTLIKINSRSLMMKKILLASAIVTMAFSSASMAAGDAAAGQAKSGICTACHNADGNSMVPMYPKLAGQHAAYLENALKIFARKCLDVDEIVSGLKIHARNIGIQL